MIRSIGKQSKESEDSGFRVVRLLFVVDFFFFYLLLSHFCNEIKLCVLLGLGDS